MWGSTSAGNYVNQKINPPSNLKNYQNMPFYPPPISKNSPKTQNQQLPPGKRLSDHNGTNPTHFRMESNRIYNENLLNNNNSDSLNKQENEFLPFGIDKKEDVLKSSISDKKNKFNDSKVLFENENELLESEIIDFKGNERLRKIVMLENNEESTKEKNSHFEKTYDPESSFDGKIIFYSF